jgi:hypothetical protein
VALRRCGVHRNVTRLVAAWQAPPEADRPWPAMKIATEYAACGDASSLARSWRLARADGAEAGLPPHAAAAIMRGLVAGLAHVHAAGMAHCDVKGANTLLTHDGRVVVADFGSAHLSRLTADETGLLAGAAAAGSAAACSTPSGDPRGAPVAQSPLERGTLWWTAPERVAAAAAGTPSDAVAGPRMDPLAELQAGDVWSAGCTALELLTGEVPWWHVASTAADMTMLLAHGDLASHIPEGPWPAAAVDFMRQCLRPDCARRPRAQDLLRHPWLSATSYWSPASLRPSLAHAQRGDGRAHFSSDAHDAFAQWAAAHSWLHAAAAVAPLQCRRVARLTHAGDVARGHAAAFTCSSGASMRLDHALAACARLLAPAGAIAAVMGHLVAQAAATPPCTVPLHSCDAEGDSSGGAAAVAAVHALAAAAAAAHDANALAACAALLTPHHAHSLVPPLPPVTAWSSAAWRAMSRWTGAGPWEQQARRTCALLHARVAAGACISAGIACTITAGRRCSPSALRVVSTLAAALQHGWQLLSAWTGVHAAGVKSAREWQDALAGTARHICAEDDEAAVHGAWGCWQLACHADCETGHVPAAIADLAVTVDDYEVEGGTDEGAGCTGERVPGGTVVQVRRTDGQWAQVRLLPASVRAHEPLPLGFGQCGADDCTRVTSAAPCSHGAVVGDCSHHCASASGAGQGAPLVTPVAALAAAELPEEDGFRTASAREGVRAAGAGHGDPPSPDALTWLPASFLSPLTPLP